MGSCPVAAVHVSEWRSIVVSPFDAILLKACSGSQFPCSMLDFCLLVPASAVGRLSRQLGLIGGTPRH